MLGERDHHRPSGTVFRQEEDDGGDTPGEPGTDGHELRQRRPASENADPANDAIATAGHVEKDLDRRGRVSHARNIELQPHRSPAPEFRLTRAAVKAISTSTNHTDMVPVTPGRLTFRLDAKTVMVRYVTSMAGLFGRHVAAL